MDKNDKDNLQFLLSVNQEGLLRWFMYADQDDLVYAEQLLQSYVLDHIDELVETTDYTEANDYLKKFQRSVN